MTIHVSGPKSTNGKVYSSRYNKWNAVERPHLFETLTLEESIPGPVRRSIPKLSSPLEHSILRKLSKQGKTISEFYDKRGTEVVFYSRKVGYFLQVLNFQPRVLDRRLY